MTFAPAPEAESRTSSKLLAKVTTADQLLCAAGFLASLWLFFVLCENVGGLWRDEVGSARLAQLPTWSWMYASVQEDSFPPLFNTCLRLWIMLGDTSDGWLQAWGYLTVLGLALALWWSTRTPAGTLPLLAGALVLFNPTMLYWGHSVRAYGLAAVLAVIFFGAIWRFAERPSPRIFAIASLVAILNAQACYQNAPLILAISLAASVVAALRRLWVRSGLILAPGFLAALSMLIHNAAIRDVQEWNILLRQDIGIGLVFGKISDALGSAGVAFTGVWVALAVGLGVFAIHAWTREGRAAIEREETRRAVFSCATVFITLAIVVVFILRVSYPTQEWYYAPMMCLLAAALEFGLSPLWRFGRFRLARIAVVMVIIIGSIPAMWTRAHTRRTNMDLIAAKLRSESTPRDLILVRPFYCGIGFQYYYKGSTPWMTIPPIAWSEVHNAYENVKPYMKQGEPMGSTFERIAATLRGGGRVWFVGGIQFLQPNQRPPASPPAPHPEYGWSDEMYTAIWGLQVGYFVQNHVTAATAVPVPCAQLVQKFENLPLVQVSGWRD